MTSVQAWRHVAFEGLGTLEQLFKERGWTQSYLDIPDADLSHVDPLAPDLLVVLGGPISANDELNYPFVAREIAMLRQRIAADKPTLGICLGAQMIARALGAAVYAGPAKEVGWGPLLLTAAGMASPVKYLAAEHTFMFHWHGETFDLPKGAVLLAGTETCLHQAFSHGKNTLAFQCHPEVRLNELESWFVGHAVEIGVSRTNVRKLRADSRRFGPALETQGAACFNQWLDGLGLK